MNVDGNEYTIKFQRDIYKGLRNLEKSIMDSDSEESSLELLFLRRRLKYRRIVRSAQYQEISGVEIEFFSLRHLELSNYLC